MRSVIMLRDLLELPEAAELVVHRITAPSDFAVARCGLIAGERCWLPIQGMASRRPPIREQRLTHCADCFIV